MIVVLGDLIADLVLHIERFPVNAKDLKQAKYIDLGPGGATNVAIAAARLGLQVGCLGEVGDDQYGEVVLAGLAREGIDVSGVLKTQGATTPVAGVIVDGSGEPAYLGYRGTLNVGSFQSEWRSRIQNAEALFVDGWADHEGAKFIVLDGLREARRRGIPCFFDPGPGNNEFDLTWHSEASSLATVLLLNEAEAERLSGDPDPGQAATKLLAMGPEMVIVKRGSAGSLVRNEEQQIELPGFTVEVVDTTGAGDSFDAAVIYGRLSGMDLRNIGTLANAVGAAKAMKRGTGHNMPTREETSQVLERAGLDPAQFMPLG